MAEKVADKTTADSACQFFHRYASDLEICKQLNLKAFRIGLNWPVLCPAAPRSNAPYHLDAECLNYYKELLTELKRSGITTFVTLFHFTLPAWLADRGGWHSRECVEAFVQFTKMVASELAPLVDYWITMNEPMAYVYQGYVTGVWPPGHRDNYIGAFQAVRHFLDAHAGAYHVLHEIDTNAQVSFIMHWRPFVAKTRWNPLDQMVSYYRDCVFNQMFPQAVQTGEFRFPFPININSQVKELSGSVPGLKGCMDYIAINYYTRALSEFKFKLPMDLFGTTANTPELKTNSLGWENYPEGFYQLLTKDIDGFRFKQDGSPYPIIITENGFPTEFSPDLIDGDWSLDDDDRIEYLNTHLTAVHNAITDGANVKGYLYWSLLDNFEWAEGLSPRFGLVRVAYPTQERTLRKSALLYADMIKNNGIALLLLLLLAISSLAPCFAQSAQSAPASGNYRCRGDACIARETHASPLPDINQPLRSVPRYFESALLEPCFAQSVSSSESSPSHTTASLKADLLSIKGGSPFLVGVLLKMEPGWHTYYKQCGDAGMPTRIIWSLPAGFKASELLWPKPEKFNDAGIITYGYRDRVLIGAKITPPAKTPNPVQIKARVKWLSCKDTCIPGQADLMIDLPVNQLTPNPAPESDLFRKLGFSGNPQNLPLAIDKNAYSAGEKRDTNTTYGIDTASSINTANGAQSILHEKLDLQGQKPLSLFSYFALAFAGGFILNFMPCVLPVIAIKIVSILSQAEDDPKRVRLLSGAFAAGIISCFLLLSVLVIGIQFAGGNVGWGFLFQYQPFLIAMCVIMLLFALSLFGLFYISFSPAQQEVEKLADKEGLAGAFFKGVLATMLSTPCTAPFLGTALGFAFTQNWATILAIFLAIGLGMSLPYLLMMVNPAWMRALPKPGAWMEKLKESMGFLLLATVVWLLSILGAIAGMETVMRTSAFLLMVAFAAWLVSRFTDLTSTSRHKMIVWLIALLVVAGSSFLCYKPATHIKATGNDTESKASGDTDKLRSSAANGIDWQPYSLTLLNKALSEKKTVLLDFTADWCLTCKLNESAVLDSQPVVDKLKALHVVTIKVDWTSQDPKISALMARFNRSGVPLYVVFPGGKPTQPIVLPEIITQGIVINALSSR